MPFQPDTICRFKMGAKQLKISLSIIGVTFKKHGRSKNKMPNVLSKRHRDISKNPHKSESFHIPVCFYQEALILLFCSNICVIFNNLPKHLPLHLKDYRATKSPLPLECQRLWVQKMKYCVHPQQLIDGLYQATKIIGMPLTTAAAGVQYAMFQHRKDRSSIYSQGMVEMRFCWSKYAYSLRLNGTKSIGRTLAHREKIYSSRRKKTRK